MHKIVSKGVEQMCLMFNIANYQNMIVYSSSKKQRVARVQWWVDDITMQDIPGLQKMMYSPNSFWTSWVSVHDEADIPDLQKITQQRLVNAQKAINSNRIYVITT
jgi:hypothetical protein